MKKAIKIGAIITGLAAIGGAVFLGIEKLGGVRSALALLEPEVDDDDLCGCGCECHADKTDDEEYKCDPNCVCEAGCTECCTNLNNKDKEETAADEQTEHAENKQENKEEAHDEAKSEGHSATEGKHAYQKPDEDVIQSPETFF